MFDTVHPALLAPLVDPFGRAVAYLRISVTDRCDFRCLYCMPETMSFLPKADLLTLEELERLAESFIALGTRKIRLTGGEPLVRRNVMHLIEKLGARIGEGLDELTLTTNGSQLSKYADALARAGIKRINVSLDTLDAGKFSTLTRWGKLGPVLDGVAAAKAAGLSIKINTVALKGFNEEEFDPMIAWCGTQGFDLVLIEVMPMGDLGGESRFDQYLPLSRLRADLKQRWTLTETEYRTGGPARYWRIAETGQRLGFITPMTHNFCESCNRVRLTCTGTLYLCLGQEDSVDLRTPLRDGRDEAGLQEVVRRAIARKPKGHDFKIDRHPETGSTLFRHMNVTGG